MSHSDERERERERGMYLHSYTINFIIGSSYTSACNLHAINAGNFNMEKKKGGKESLWREEGEGGWAVAKEGKKGGGGGGLLLRREEGWEMLLLAIHTKAWPSPSPSSCHPSRT